MLNVMDKIIKEDDAIATIKFKDGISEEEAQKINNIISKNYDQKCHYIMKIDRNTYKGDMACLSGFGNHIIEDLNKANLKNNIELYEIYNKRTDELEDFLED